VQYYFSMQVAMNKWFLLNPEKNLTQIRLVVFDKTQNTHILIPKNDVTLGYSDYQLNC